MMKKGILLVRFNNKEGTIKVLQGVIHHFDRKPIMKAWKTEIDFSKEEMFFVPIWVKLPGQEFKYRSIKGLNKIGSLIGKPLLVDRHTKQKIDLSFAKLLVEVQIRKPLLEMVHFRYEMG